MGEKKITSRFPAEEPIKIRKPKGPIGITKAPRDVNFEVVRGHGRCSERIEGTQFVYECPGGQGKNSEKGITLKSKKDIRFSFRRKYH